ncbi:Scr1 family TA system antitoxin-like transcriptional regulator [Streptomyces chrestomyceticus]|nr:Scr1 family TA system antitoxin-like transcriptional regulator [Streptomyces chrestomyceticus]
MQWILGRGERTACGTRPHLSVSPSWHVPRTAAVGVQVRLARQERLADEPMLTMWPVVTEDVLLQQVGGPTVVRAQLEHLPAMAEEPNVTVQASPFSPGAHAGMFGSYLLLSFARM